MAKIVGGFLMSHDPFMFTHRDAAKPDVAARCFGAYDEIAKRIGKLNATTAIIFGADHFILFGPHCLPSMLIGVGDVDGPIERLPGLKQRAPIAGNEKLAEHILNFGYNRGFDWSVGHALTVDHSIGIPHQLCVAPNDGVKTIPIYLASAIEPRIRMNRVREVGKMIADAVAAWPEDERVVTIGSGGISHWVGDENMGRVNEEFDRKVLSYIEAGNLDALTELSDEYILENGGNGALEIRQLLCAMTAVPDVRGEVIAYEPVREWATGLAYVQLHAGQGIVQ